jgi:hypothetical protein
MSKKFWKFGLVVPAMLGVSLLAAKAGQASEEVLSQVSTYTDGFDGVVAANGTSGGMDQVTSVSQLTDVKPTDWAFQALQSLVERYGCIVGYPDKTYRGNRPLSRFEFAAGLNACLDRVNELIAAATADLVTKEDLAKLQRLQEEFAAELATLRGRVDALEVRTATLEAQQFSTTTKLKGEVIFALAGALGGDKAVPSGRAQSNVSVDENTTFSDRARVMLVSSFTGKDQLFTRIQASNVPNLTNATGTRISRLSFDGTTGDAAIGGNDAFLNKLYYRFPVGAGTLTVDAIGGEFYNNMNNFNSTLASDASGSISRFARFNPLYRFGQGGSGATVRYPLGKQFEFALGYLATRANNPDNGSALFNGPFGAIAQLGFKSGNLELGVNYVRGYDRPLTATSGADVSGGTGTTYGTNPFGNGVPTSSDNVGLQGSFRISPSFILSAWGGWTQAYNTRNSNEATIWNWAVGLSFPNVGNKGSLAAITFGAPPYVTGSDRRLAPGQRAVDNASPYQLQLLYRYKLNDNLSITPGFLVLFNPDGNSSNDTSYVGVIRTTFTF